MVDVEVFPPILVDTPFASQYLTSIIYVSLYVSCVAVLLSTAVSLPIALGVGFADFRGNGTSGAVSDALELVGLVEHAGQDARTRNFISGELVY